MGIHKKIFNLGNDYAFSVSAVLYIFIFATAGGQQPYFQNGLLDNNHIIVSQILDNNISQIYDSPPVKWSTGL